MRIADLAKHVRKIAKENGIRVFRLKRVSGDPRTLCAFCNPEERWIEIPKIRSHQAYAIAMHEIGHILGPWQHNTRLESEAGAWKWARENCITWSTAMEKTMHRGMFSYLEAAIEESKDLFKKPLKIPERDHYFWQCVPPVGEGPSWLNNNLFFVPWRAVLDHPERPRCGICSKWQTLHQDSERGLCTDPEFRLGRLTPQEAFCENYLCKKKSSNS